MKEDAQGRADLKGGWPSDLLRGVIVAVLWMAGRFSEHRQGQVSHSQWPSTCAQTGRGCRADRSGAHVSMLQGLWEIIIKARPQLQGPWGPHDLGP